MDIKPMYIIGWNTFGFDDNYLMMRTKYYAKLKYKLPDLSLFPPISSKLVVKKVSNAAKGYNVMKYLDMNGISSIDAMSFLKFDGYQDDSYSLSSISKKELQDDKVDLKPSQIFEYFESNEEEKIILIGEYCQKDVVLPICIMAKLQLFEKHIELNRMSFTAFKTSMFSGPSCKSVGSTMAFCARNDTILFGDASVYSDVERDIPGALVIDPVRGYFNSRINDYEHIEIGDKRERRIRLICIGDFSGLYPASGRAENASHDTLLHRKKFKQTDTDTLVKETIEEACKRVGLSMSDIEEKKILVLKKLDKDEVRDDMYVVQKTQKAGKGSGKVPYQVMEQSVYFVKKDIRKGILVKIWEFLTDERSRYKKLMEKTTDPNLKKVYNNRQLAIKLTSNSLYGATAARVVKPLYYFAIPAVITQRGRFSLLTVVKYLCDNYKDLVIRYGDTDSVFFEIDYGTMVADLISDFTQHDDEYLNTMTSAEIREKIYSIVPRHESDNNTGYRLRVSLVWLDKVCELITKYIGKFPLSFAAECIVVDGLFNEKKRYSLYTYVSENFNINKPLPEGKIKQMGDDTKKRGTGNYLKETLMYIKNSLLKYNIPTTEIMDGIRDRLINFLEGNVSMKDVIMSVQLNKYDENKTGQLPAHKQLANRIAKRDPSNAPVEGQRVQFVYTMPDLELVRKWMAMRAKDRPKIGKGDVIEDPVYLAENELSICYPIYIVKNFISALTPYISAIHEEETPEQFFENIMKPYMTPEIEFMIKNSGKKSGSIYVNKKVDNETSGDIIYEMEEMRYDDLAKCLNQ
jgi:DNA polymerase elongation subunit (family B)